MKILAAIDFSSVSELVIDQIGSLVAGRDAQVFLLHVAEPNPDFVGYDAGPDVVRDQVAKEYRDEHRQLQAFAEQLRDAGIDSKATLIQGAIVETILERAQHLDVDLILMGTHGHGAMYQILVGSISEGVLHESKKPVLLIPAQPKER